MQLIFKKLNHFMMLEGFLIFMTGGLTNSPSRILRTFIGGDFSGLELLILQQLFEKKKCDGCCNVFSFFFVIKLWQLAKTNKKRSLTQIQGLIEFVLFVEIATSQLPRRTE